LKEVRSDVNKFDLFKDQPCGLHFPQRKAEEIVDMVFSIMPKDLIDGDRIEIEVIS
jgi:nucleoid DNA-binding protein